MAEFDNFGKWPWDGHDEVNDIFAYGVWNFAFEVSFRKFFSMSHTYDVIYGRLKEGGRKHTLELLSQNTLKVSVFSALKDVN